jgi:hypothetical protein
MDKIGIPERNDEYRLARHLTAQYDAPAYVRRALQTQEALDRLHAVCRKQREAWLKEVRARLTALCSVTGSWGALRPLVSDEGQLEMLARLPAALGQEPSFRPDGRAGWGLAGALRALCHSLERFNRRWRHFVGQQDLRPVNERRDGYNRYYTLEKECALRSVRLARHGFQRLPPLTVEDLLAEFPLLPVPRLG